MIAEVELREAYKDVFGPDTSYHDNGKRREFLASVVNGRVKCHGEMMSIEDALKTEGSTQKLLEFDAVDVAREWYLKAETEPAPTARQTARSLIDEKLEEINSPYISEKLEECMEVLYKCRIKDLLGGLDELIEEATNRSIEDWKEKDEAIRTRVKQLMKVRNPEIQNGAIDRMSKYNESLRIDLDHAITNGDEHDVFTASANLSVTGVKNLQEYAEKQTKNYF